MKKRIIILCLKMDIYKWNMMEFNKLNKKNSLNIEVHECINFIYPGANLNHGKKPKKIKIIKFKTFSFWKKYMNRLQTIQYKNEKVIIFDLISLYNNFGVSLNIFLLNLFLKNKKIFTIRFQSSGLPDLNTNEAKKFNFERLKNNLFTIMNRPFYSFGILKMLFLNKLIHLFKIYPDQLFYSGNVNKLFLKKNFNKYMKLTEYSSWEYSKFLSFNKNHKSKKRKKTKYAVFLADRDFKLKTENQIFDKKGEQYLSEKYWKNYLNLFFNELEKIFKLKIIVAAHPKTNIRNDIKNYRPRRVIENSTLRLMRNATFAITTHSTSICYAVTYKKPIFFINSNEIKSQKNLDLHIKLLANYFGSKPLNINQAENKKNLKSFNRLKYSKFKKFEYDFLSSLKNKKENYKIIYDEIINIK